MRNFDFYEFVGIILPGSMMLIGIGLLFDLGSVNVLLIPNGVGVLGAHLLAAYVLGHLVQAIGNIIEIVYWKSWKGMPTDWPITRTGENRFPRAKDAVVKICRSSLDSLSLDIWRSLIAQARSITYASRRASRLQYFNGTYGLFRGLIATILIVSCFAWMSSIPLYIVYPFLLVIMIISFNRMHRFGIHYATELFANVTELGDSGES